MKRGKSIRALNEDGGGEAGYSKKFVGSVCLVTVAFLWGSYAPAMKLIFSSPMAPLPSALSFIKAILSTFALSVNYAVLRSREQKTKSREVEEMHPREKGKGVTARRCRGVIGKALTWKSGSLLYSVMELGLWESLGTFSQTIGISLTSATTAAFLIHSVTVFTPILASFTGDRLKPIGWMGCLLSLIGSLCVTVDLSVHSMTLSFGSIGDGFTLLAAMFYALATVRVGTLVEDFHPAQLSAGNAVVSLFCASLWTLTDIFRMGGGSHTMVSLWPGVRQFLPWIAILWIAMGPESLASLLRNKGQQILPPSRAQILFASTPFWSALIASQVLNTEVLGGETWLGGAFILMGALLSSIEWTRNV